MMVFSRCLCGEIEIKTLYKIDKRRIGECTECSLIRTVDVPLQYERLYTTNLRYHGGKKDYFKRFDHDIAVAEMRLDRHLRHCQLQPFTIMDVGCANGAFLTIAKQRGIHSHGIEPNPIMAEWARDRSEAQIFKSWDDSERLSYDLITYHDVIEHIKDPLSELRKAKERLRIDGLIVVDTPDGATLDGEGKHHLKPVEHLWYFKEQDLHSLLFSAGFKIHAFERPIPGKIVAYASPGYEGP